MSLTLFRREHTLTECLDGLFTTESVARTRALTYADAYISQPSRGDFEQTLKYCYILIHLTEFFEAHKMSFLKLRHPFQFVLTLQDEMYVTTSHQAEAITQVLMLGSVLSGNLMTVLKVDRSSPPKLIFLADFDNMSDSNLENHYSSVRKVIGLLHYCISKIIPRAFDTMRQLDELEPTTVQHILSYYHTLRVMGTWIAAAIKFRWETKTSSDLIASTMHMHSGMRLMQECMMIVDDIKKRQERNERAVTLNDDASLRPHASDVIVTTIMRILKASCQYETDVRCSRDVSLMPEIRYAFFKRAKLLSIEADFPDVCVWQEKITPKWNRAKSVDEINALLDMNRLKIAGDKLPSVEIMKMGENPLDNNPFEL